VNTKIAIDEGVRLLADARLHVDAVRAAGDIAILKAIPLGGVRRALDIAAELAMPAVVSGSMDSSVGLAQGIALAAALPQLDYACGLLTGSLLAQDVIAQPLVPCAGMLAPGRVSPDPHILTDLTARVDSETTNYWRERVRACYEIVEAA
jgi:O-succinylbenzoate synthase